MFDEPLENEGITLKKIIGWLAIIFIGSFILSIPFLSFSSNLSKYIHLIVSKSWSFICLYVIMRKEKLTIKDCFKNITIKNIIFSLSAVIILMILRNMLSDLLSRIPLITFVPIDIDDIDSAYDPSLFWFDILNSVILAPIFEEVLLRGIILDGLTKQHSNMYAIIVSSIVFALAHVFLPTKILALISGIILGICYIRTKSIFMCILIHSLYNFSNRFT